MCYTVPMTGRGTRQHDRRCYRFFDHTADCGVEITGSSAQSLFENAAFSLFDIMTYLNDVDPRAVRRVTVTADGWNDLFIAFLRRMLSLYTVEGFLVRHFTCDSLDESHITGSAYGEPFDRDRHEIIMEIKAVTYHQALCEQRGRTWRGRIVCDV